MAATINLGLMPPLTGLVEMYGPEIVWAARIACEEINDRGGVLGRPLKLIIEDDGSLPDSAVPAAQRLIDSHGCVAIIGNLLSNSRIAVVEQIAAPRQIPLLNFSFYEGSITNRYFFHFAALPNQQIDKMIPYMAKCFGLKMFFAGNNYEWPRGSIDAAKRSLQQIEGDILGEEYLDIGVSSADITQLLGHVARSGADVFVPYFAGSDQITLLTLFSEMGLKKHMAVVMGHYDEMMVSHLPPHVREGFYSSNTYFMSVDTQENRRYLERLARQPGINGVWPYGNGVLTNFGEGAYVCVHAFAKAAEDAGTTDAEALVNALESAWVVGPQGIVEMDAATHHAYVNTFLSRCNADGTFSIVESFGRTPPRIPERYRSGERTALGIESPPSPQATARIAAELGIARRKVGTAQQILSIADMAILATDAHGIIIESNQSACIMFGYRAKELLGRSVHMLLPPHSRQQHAEHVKMFVESEETELRMSWRHDVMGYRKDGSFFPLEASIAKFWNEDGWLLVVTMNDITKRRKAEEDLTWQATHDNLTGLPNRGLIRERLVNTMQRSRRNGLSVALIFLDLDGFKLVNDAHGHEAGDMILKTVAVRLMGLVRQGDTVARLHGDEFVVLCEQIEQPSAISILADRIVDTLRQPCEFNSLRLFVTASIGIAIGNGRTHSADDMLRQADTAMYAAKQQGGDSWHFFTQSLHEQARQRLTVTNGLRMAIEQNELSIRFQPIVTATSGRIVGAELLLRWNPSGGEISPAVFIPIAEITGVIKPIGAWVFRQACRAEVEWRSRWGENAPYISVNISAQQLNEETAADDFFAILHETGAIPSRLLLEITETSLMADVETNLRVLSRLTDLGMRVAVDDFGTGYSSLAQLTRLPVHVLKIDRAFVDGMGQNEESRTVTRAVIGLGRALKLKLVAEGVENNVQRRELCNYGCDFIQGYYFHRPLQEKTFIETVDHEIQKGFPPGDRVSTHFLIYVSQSVKPTSRKELEGIIDISRKFNRSNGITGCLLYQDGYYMQMLEGEREILFSLMEKIKANPLHRGVRLVIEGPTNRRFFMDWGMVLRDLSPLQDSPNFSEWQHRKINFFELAEDAHLCYSYVIGFASFGSVQ